MFTGWVVYFKVDFCNRGKFLGEIAENFPLMGRSPMPPCLHASMLPRLHASKK